MKSFFSSLTQDTTYAAGASGASGASTSVDMMVEEYLL